MSSPGKQASIPSRHALAPPLNLPLSLLRHGAGLIGFGLLFGFAVPFTPYPRLGLTAHIQFAIDGTMIVAAGLLLNSRPFTSSPPSSNGEREGKKRVVDYLALWQRRVVYWGVAGVWVMRLSEVANAWWGTQWVLSLAHDAAGLRGKGPAPVWMERVVQVAHVPFAVVLSTVWPIVSTALFAAD